MVFLAITAHSAASSPEPTHTSTRAGRNVRAYNGPKPIRLWSANPKDRKMEMLHRRVRYAVPAVWAGRAHSNFCASLSYPHMKRGLHLARPPRYTSQEEPRLSGLLRTRLRTTLPNPTLAQQKYQTGEAAQLLRGLSLFFCSFMYLRRNILRGEKIEPTTDCFFSLGAASISPPQFLRPYPLRCLNKCLKEAKVPYPSGIKAFSVYYCLFQLNWLRKTDASGQQRISLRLAPSPPATILSHLNR